jgi:citrate lyase subunit beta/citryl-CoA lyase
MTRILRSLLFVPGDSPSKMAKAAALPAGALIIDWEDAVLPAGKGAARELTLAFLRRRTAALPVFIRYNRAGSAAFWADCETLREFVPDGVVLSKCRSADEVKQLAAALDQSDAEGRCLICPMVESPEGLLNASAIAAAARVAMVAFGAEDFSAEMRIIRTADEMELLYARSALVASCRAAGKEPIDSPCLEFRDLEQVKAAAGRARNLGFSGKLAIHPSQLAGINERFSPTAAEIEEARRVVDLFGSPASGVAAAHGQMVDEAVVRRARLILELAE